MTTRGSSLLTLWGALALVACGGETTPADTSNNTPGEVTLSSLAVGLDATRVGVGAELVATATGRYSDGTEKDVTADVTWMVDSASVLAAVDGEPGRYTATGEGMATISAELDGVFGSADVTVSPPELVKLELFPPSGDFGYGGHLTLAVVSEWSDGTREQVTDDVEWSSSRPSVAIVSSQDSGRVVSFGEGTTTLTASLDGVEVSGDFTVTAPRVEYLRVSPENIRVEFGQPVQFEATAIYSDHDPQGTAHIEDVTSQVQWSSSDEAILVIDANGMATAMGDGDVVITATADGVSASTIARTVSIACPYPDNPATGIQYDTVIPPLFWLDAYTETGAAVDFRLEETYCNAAESPSILFVIGAGWCPYCPDYMRAVNDVAQDLDDAGAIVVYVEIETNGGAPANNEQANAIVDREVTMPLGPSIRVGDGVTQGANQPFGRAVNAIPSAFMVRTSDMRVIASQARSGSRLNWVQIAQNPDRLY